MSQINIDPDHRDDRPVPEDRYYRDDRYYHGPNPWTDVARNITWAIAAVIVIAALALAVVYVVQNVHP